MQNLTLESRQLESQKKYGQDTRKKIKKNYSNSILRQQNTSVMDIMGLSWIFVKEEEDYYS